MSKKRNLCQYFINFSDLFNKFKRACNVLYVYTTCMITYFSCNSSDANTRNTQKLKTD